MDDDYLERTGADRMIQAMVQQLQVMRPANPAEFMVQYLQDNYVKKDQKKRSTSTDYCEFEAPNEEEYDRPYLVVPDSFKRKRRGAICCDVPTSQGYEPLRTQFPKSAETRLCLEDALAKNIMFAHLEPDQLTQIFAVMTESKLRPGEIVFRQGDEADKFYVLEKGECDVFAIKSGISQHVATYDEGSAFGELALVADTPRTSTVKAKTEVVVWAIDRLAFRLIVTETTKRTRIIYDTFLEKVPILAHLTKAERAIVADSLSTEQFWDGDVIVKQGDTGDKFYIIVQGSVEISRFNEPIGTLETSHYFGEIALLTNRPRAATITAVGDTKCVCLDRGSFNRLLGPIEDILLRNMEMYNLYISTNV